MVCIVLSELEQKPDWHVGIIAAERLWIQVVGAYLAH